MFDSKSIKSLPFFSLLAMLAIIVLSGPANEACAQTLMIKGVTSVDVSIKKKPCCKLMDYTTDSEGNFDLGNLKEGIYTLTFSPAAPAASANAKTFYESRSNTARYGIVVEGAVKAPVVTVIDFRQNLALNTRTLGFEAINEITIEVTGEGIVKGKVLILGNEAGAANQ